MRSSRFSLPHTMSNAAGSTKWSKYDTCASPSIPKTKKAPCKRCSQRFYVAFESNVSIANDPTIVGFSSTFARYIVMHAPNNYWTCYNLSWKSWVRTTTCNCRLLLATRSSTSYSAQLISQNKSTILMLRGRRRRKLVARYQMGKSAAACERK